MIHSSAKSTQCALHEALVTGHLTLRTKFSLKKNVGSVIMTIIIVACGSQPAKLYQLHSKTVCVA